MAPPTKTCRTVVTSGAWRHLAEAVEIHVEGLRSSAILQLLARFYKSLPRMLIEFTIRQTGSQGVLYFYFPGPG